MKDVEEASSANGTDENGSGAAATENDALLLPNDDKAEEVDQTSITRISSSVSRHVKRYIPSFLKKAKINRRGHLRKRSSVREILEQGLEVVMEDVHLTAVDVRDAFVGELREADDGDTYFLDMSLSRSLAVPPDNLRSFLKETTSFRRVIEEEEEEEIVPSKGLPLLPFLSLLAAVIAVSSNGTALSLQVGVPASLKLYWRMTATAIALSFAAFKSLYYTGWPKLTAPQWISFALAVGCFTFQNLVFVIAIQYTSIGNAVIFANSQALLLLAGKAFIGTPIVWMEATGALVAFSGAMLCAAGESSPVGQESHALAILGDVLALCAAIGGVGYLTFAKAIRHTMSVTLFMFMVMFTGSFLVLIYMLVSNVGVSFSADANHGLFGWTNWRPDRLLIELWIVIVCNLTGTMGFLNAMQHFDNLIIAVATLLEPMVASLIAFALGVGELPGVMGWIGNILVVIGTVGVVYPSVDSGGGVH